MRKPWLWAAIALQVLVLAVMMGINLFTLQTGVAVRLKTEPLDPFDPLRGAYVHLQPAIARLDAGLFPGDVRTLNSGDTVYVTLHPDQPYWRAVAVGRERPPVRPDEVAVRAQVQYVDTYQDRGIFLRYSFQDFFTTDERAHKLELQRTGVDMEIRVDRFGNGALEKVYVDGEPLNWQ